MPWELKSDRPIYLQLIEQISRLIISGVYKPGDRLPSVRDLAAEAAVNPNTMQKALTELERDGLINTNRTNGKFISEDDHMIQDMKFKLVKEQLSEFLKQMDQLGVTKQDIIHLLTEASETND